MFGEFSSAINIGSSTDIVRLILYFPVSALVTLFGNILQNPQDPRARSDVRLMNLVVNFLSLLITEEENGGVKRMLGVCSEFERIAKVVLDKAEKESSSRRKRKNVEEQSGKTKQMATTGPPQTPMISNGQVPAMAGVFSPNGIPTQLSQNGFSPANSMNNGSPDWNANYDGNGSEYMTPRAGMTPFSEIQQYSNANNGMSPFTGDSFQQPFVPQDLWQMPMTLEYDWADLTGGVYPSFENGVMGDPNLSVSDNAHLQHIQQQHQHHSQM